MELEVAGGILMDTGTVPPAVDGEDAEAANPEKKGPGRGRKRNGAETAEAKKKAKSSADLEEKTKKCKRCKKCKPVSEFYNNQAGCKQCSKDIRNLENHAKNSKETAWFKGLDDGQKDLLIQAYNKEKERAEKERARVKFNMSVYKQRSLHATGVRKEGRKRFMTEQAYYAWTRTPEGGSLTQTQAEQKWQEMKDDEKTPSQGSGVEFKLAIPIFDELVDYDDQAEQREIERQQRLNAKMTEEDMDKKVDVLVRSNQRDLATDVKVASALSGTDVAQEGLVLPKLAGLAKSKLFRAEGDDGDQEDEPMSSPKGEAKESESPKSSPKWFDVQAKRAGTQRQLEQVWTKRKTAVDALITSMREVQDAARTAVSSGRCEKDCKIEMMILENRVKALELVRGGSESDFATYVSTLRQEAQAQAGTRSAASGGSAKELTLLQAGPCHNFESLYTLTQAENCSEAIQEIGTEDDLKNFWGKIKAITSHWDELMAACKTAQTELKKAAEVKGVAAAKKATSKAKAKGKAAAKSKVRPMYRVFDLRGGVQIEEHNTLPTAHDMQKPLILKKDALPAVLKAMVDHKKETDTASDVVKDILKFRELFSKSDLRFTAGKAQSPFSSESRGVLRACLDSFLDCYDVAFADSIQPFSCVGCIAKHRSVQFEVGGTGSLRLSLSGERQIALLATEKVKDLLEQRNHAKPEDERDKVTFASVLGFVTYMQEQDLEELMTKSGPEVLYCGKVGIGEMVYTPAGMVACEQVASEEDHYGCKFPLAFVGAHGDKEGVRCLRALSMEAKDLNRKNLQLDQLLDLIEQKERELAAAHKAANEEKHEEAPAQVSS